MAKRKRIAKKKAKKNPIDPNLLARSVVEVAIGEPLIPPLKPLKMPKKKTSKA